MRRRRPVVEHVAQVCITARAADFDPRHAKAVVFDRFHVAAIEWLGETWPARSRIELRIAGKQRQIAEPTGVGAGLVIVEERPAEWTLRSVMQNHFALLRRELLSQFIDTLGGERRNIVA